MKIGTKFSVTISMFHLVINFFYAYAFFFGGYLRYSSFETGNVEYSGGKILAIMFCIVIGCFTIGAIGDNVKAVIEGRVAGKMIWDVIDHVPSIQPDEAGTEEVTADKVNG